MPFLLKYFFLKLFFGRFSYRFQQFVTNSNKLPALKKNFLQPCGKLDGLNHYRSSLVKTEALPQFHTTTKIEFQKIPFGLSFFSVKRKKGHFSCFDISNYQGHYWSRIGYRERIFNTSVRLIFHFLDKKFFFGEIFFPDVLKVNPQQVAHSLIKKYTQTNEIPPSNFKIIGPNGFIFFENTGINLSIKYIHTENEHLNEILESITHYSPFSKESSEVVSLEDFI